jgi:hypothetical protein
MEIYLCHGFTENEFKFLTQEKEGKEKLKEGEKNHRLVKISLNLIEIRHFYYFSEL